MNNSKNQLSAEEERGRKIWKYYNWTRVVLCVLFIAGLFWLCSLG